MFNSVVVADVDSYLLMKLIKLLGMRDFLLEEGTSWITKLPFESENILGFKAICSGKKSIEFIINFLSKYIYKGATDIKFPADISNPSNPHMQRSIDVYELSYV